MMAKRKKGRGGRRAGAGRKPKPKGEKQANAVASSFTDSEYAKLRDAAGEEPPGTYIRRLVLRHLARRRR